MAHNDLNKEMVDLVMKIKKYLREKYDIAIALADPELLDKLVKLKNMDDPVLQGMLSYLMALAGSEWSDRFEAEDSISSAPEPGAEKKKLFGRYRGKSVSTRGEEKSLKSAAEKHAETRYRGQRPHEEDKQGEEEPQKERKPLRYYRGQPIYDD